MKRFLKHPGVKRALLALSVAGLALLGVVIPPEYLLIMSDIISI